MLKGKLRDASLQVPGSIGRKTLAGSLAAFAKLQVNIKNIKMKSWTLSNISDEYFFRELPLKTHVFLGYKHASSKYFS